MTGTGGYAIPVQMPLKASKTIKTKMSKAAKQHFDSLMALDIDVFEDEISGDLYSKITDTRTGKTVIKKCIFTDED